MIKENTFFTEYFISQFNKILECDKQNETPMFKSIKSDFIKNFSQRLVNKKRVMIGISGESASGKTTICNTIKQVTEKLNLPIEVLSADNYFKDISKLIKQHGSFDKLLEAGYDVDSPDNFNMEQLYNDLFELSEGFDVKIPQYLVNGTGISLPKAIEKKSKKIILIEGMASMYGKVADLLDIKIYIDIDPEIQEKWFLYRALTSRNQTEEDAKKQLDYVRHASKKYILPKKNNSDIIINGALSLDYFKQIIECFHSIINNYNKEF